MTTAEIATPPAAPPFAADKRVQRIVEGVLRHGIKTPAMVLGELKKISSDAKDAGMRLRYVRVESMFVEGVRMARASRSGPSPVPELIAAHWGEQLDP